MTDWRAYVRTHLPALNIRAERESEIIDELALQLETAYDAASSTSRDCLVDGVLMQPLPYAEADRLALIKATTPDDRETPEITYPDSVDLAAAGAAFRSMAALMPFAGTTTMTEPPPSSVLRLPTFASS